MNLGGQWQVGLSGAYNRNQSAAFENTSMGPMLNVSSVFREGMIRSSLAGAWLSTYVGKHKQSEVFNASVTNSIRVAKKHAVSINLYYLSNQEIGELGKKFSEVRGMVNYNYSF
jgi:hypothetical protein